MNKNLNKIIVDYVKNVMKQVNKDCVKTLNEVAKDLHYELIKMYDSYITTFYSYPTKSYVRHGMTIPGSGGVNLFSPAEGITVQYGKRPKICVNINASGMQGGYKNATPIEVLDQVLAGIRYPDYNPMSWTGEYNGLYFSYKGTLHEAFNDFDSTFEDIAWRAFIPRWRQKGYK